MYKEIEKKQTKTIRQVDRSMDIQTDNHFPTATSD